MADTNNSLFKYYNDLPPKSRGLIVFSILAISTFAVWEIIQAVKARNAVIASQATIVTYANDLQTQISAGNPPAQPDSQYKIWAAAIVSALTGKDYSFAICWPSLEYSNSGDTVAAIIGSLSNDADFLSLQIAFGTQTINKGWLESNYTNVTLGEALHDQFQQCEIDGFNALMKANNISYSF